MQQIDTELRLSFRGLGDNIVDELQVKIVGTAAAALALEAFAESLDQAEIAGGSEIVREGAVQALNGIAVQARKIASELIAIVPLRS